MLPVSTVPSDEYARLLPLFERNSTQQASQLRDDLMATTPASRLVYTNHGAAQVPAPRGRLMNKNSFETMSSQELDEL